MIHLGDQLQDITVLSTFVRLLLAVILGGIIGIERGSKSRPAGFRTHILVCVGSCLAMLTNQFVFETMTELADPTRLGAQVITGVGFLGVGTILVTGRHKIKGLTTAAGLWASACMGLAIGIGYYIGAILAGILIFFALFTFGKLEIKVEGLSRHMELYIEIDSMKSLKEIRKRITNAGIDIHGTHFGKTSPISGEVGVHFTMTIPKKMQHEEVITFIEEIEGILLIEDI
jgi:putative Mg2+ transporter-C (MgtC) family protein